MATDRPVQFQTNQRGAWKTAVQWNAADEVQNDRVLDAADALLRAVNEPGRLIKGRIVTDDGLQTVLMRWTAADGWRRW